MSKNLNEVVDCLLNHRSIRQFEDREIPADIVETLLNAGVRAATGGNLQTYSLFVVDDRETRDQLNIVDEYHDLSKIPLIIISLIDTYRLQRWFQANNAEKAYTNEATGFFIGFWDAIIALHNITIAAESMGLGAFYDGNVLLFNLQELFDTPEGTFPAGMVCIGYPHPDVNPRLSTRLPLEAVVHRKRYTFMSDEQIKELYKEREVIWNRVSDEKKSKLADDNIFNLPQAIAKQKFSKDFVVGRSKLLSENLRRSGFNFFYPDEEE